MQNGVTCQNALLVSSCRSLLKSYKNIGRLHGSNGLHRVIDQHQQVSQGVLSPTDLTGQTTVQSLVQISTAKWLAKSFCHLHPQVKGQTSRFKQENIQCVDSLPCAQDLCAALFPRAMVVLFEDWLVFTHAASFPSADEHSGKRRKPSNPESSALIYPFIQLILEFANNTLVSGVAHVLFTRLILDQPESTTSAAAAANITAA